MKTHSPLFYQDGPILTNPFAADHLLKSYLKWKLPQEIRGEVEKDLHQFGERCAGELLEISRAAENAPPKLNQFDPWGRRIDEIEVSPAWGALDRVSAEEGLVAIGYERKQGEYSRLYQFAKLYLFHPSSAFYTCPLAMTDGAARLLEIHGTSETAKRSFRHLTSRDPAEFWTSGQWMTERTGGSDVSTTTTLAKADGTRYRLYGDKWFTSATTSQMSLALAKVEGATDAREGLSLFLIEIRDKKGALQNIRIHRLKEKLGTDALPTAELSMEGTPAVLIGEIGAGVRTVSSLLNVSRLYNSICALGTQARILQLATDYSTRRRAFGAELALLPLHTQTLAGLKVEHDATFLLTFETIHLLGKEEVGSATPEEKNVLRLLTPLAKLWSAKQCLGIVSEGLESFGGAGYIENTGIPRLLRDAQVFSIWEGTTNVLSLDVLRALGKNVSQSEVLEAFIQMVNRKLSTIKGHAWLSEIAEIKKSLGVVKTHSATLDAMSASASARAFAFSLARIFAATLLIERATAHAQDAAATLIAKRFLKSPLMTLFHQDEYKMENSQTILGLSNKNP